jgi:excisionase family DNA binding protein
MNTPEPKAALYVRIPQSEAAKLDRAAFELKASKQDLVAGLVARYVQPDSPARMRELGRISASAQPPGFTSTRRRETTIEVEDGLTVGRASFQPSAEPREIMTLDELAAWLEVPRETVEELAAAGKLPGRKLGDEWRFARAAILDWLSEGSG